MLLAGGHDYRFLNMGRRVLKKIDISSNEDKNYAILKNTHLAEFIPKHYKNISLDGNRFVKMENLVPGSGWDIIDIKLAYVKNPPLCYCYDKHFRVVGMVTNGKKRRIDKFMGQKASYEALFLHIMNHTKHVPIILKMLKRMCFIITNKDRLYGSSLFIAIRGNECVIKIIDFSDFNSRSFEKRPNVDINFYDIESALENLHTFYTSIFYHRSIIRISCSRISCICDNDENQDKSNIRLIK